MPRLFRFLRYALRWLTYSLGFLVVAGILFSLFLGFTSPGARLVALGIERFASTPDQIIRISEPGPLLTGGFTASSLSLFDSQGLYAEIRDIDIAWSPLSLLSRRFDASRVTVGSTNVKRLPAPSTETKEVRSGFALPLDIRIDALDLKDVVIGKEIAGTDQMLSLQGSLDATSQSIATTFSLGQPARPDAKAFGTLVYDPAANALKLEATVSEPKGGMLARLLRLPGEPAVDIKLAGEGPLSQWRGKATAALDGTQVLMLDGTHALASDGFRTVSLLGGGSFAALLPPALRPMFAGETRIDLSAAFDNGKAFRIDRGLLQTGALMLSASGTVNTQGPSDLKVDLAGTNGPIDFRMPLSGGEARLAIHSALISLVGDARAARLDVAGDIGEVSLQQGRISAVTFQAHSDSFDLTTRSGALTATVQTGATQFVNASLDRAARGPVKLDGVIGVSPESISFTPLTLESASIGGTLAGAYNLVTGTLATDVKLFALPATLPEAIASKFETTIALTGKVTTDADGGVSATDLVLTSGLVQAKGAVQYTADTLAASLSGSVSDIGKLMSDASGAATFKVDLSGPVDTLVIAADVASERAVLAGRQIDDLAVTARATAGASQQDAKISATGMLSGQAVTLASDVAVKDGLVSLPTLDMQLGRNRLTGAIDLTADFKPNGTLAFQLPDLAPLVALAGQTLSGDLDGSARIATTDGVTSLAVNATGTSLLRDALTVTAPRADVTIADIRSLDLRGTIAAQAIAQGNNRLEGATLDVAKAGDLTNFTLAARYDDAPVAARGAVRLGGLAIGIDLASFSAAPRKIAVSLAAPTTLAIENGAVQLQGLSLITPAGVITVTGSAGARLDLKVLLTGQAGETFRLPLAQGEAAFGINTVDVTVAGPIDAATLDIAADLSSAALPQGSAEAITLAAHGDAFNLSAPSGALTARLATGATTLVNSQIDALVKGPLTIDAALDVTSEVIGFSPVRIDSANLDGTVEGRFTLADSSLDAGFTLSVAPAGLPAAVAAKFDAPVAIAGRLATGPEGAVTVSQATVTSTTVTATGSAALAEGALTANVSGTLPDLGKLLADAKGAATFETALSGPLDALAVKAKVVSSSAELAGRGLSDLVVTADGTLDKTSPQAQITATGALGGQAIDVKAQVLSQDGRTTVPVLEARIGDNVLTGALGLTADFVPDGTLDFTFPDVGLLAAMAGQKASGDLSGSAVITSQAGVTSVAIKAGGSGIQRADLIITKPRADITIADLKTLSIKGNLSVETIAQGDNRLTGLRLDFDRPSNRTAVSLDATYDGAPVSARGEITSVGGRTAISLASFSATPKGIPVKLGNPTTIAIDNGVASLQALVVQAAGGTVSINGSAGEKLDLSIKLSALPAKLANTFSPSAGADGTIGGTLAVSGTASAPVVVYDLRWANAVIAQTKAAGVGPLDITAKGRLADNVVSLDTGLSGAGGLSFLGTGTVGLAGARPLVLKANGTVPFSLVGALLAQQGFTLTGNAAVDLSIGGTVAAPAITGTISTSGARLLDVRRNLALNDLAARVALTGQQATISSLTGNLASGGSVSVSGTIGIVPGSGFPADLAVRLNNATYVDGSLFTANADGALTLKGPLTATPTLGGKVTISKAAITIPQKLPSALSDINIQHKNAPADVRQMQADIRKDEPKASSGGGGGGIAFDLTVVSPGKLFARGRGIDAELGGDVTIRGTAAQPIVSGGFRMRRGRLEILGKRLDFSKGTISFGGGLVPTLDLDATSTAGSTTITVNVAGVASNPAVTFSSSPALPQDEVLAQLIFNRSLSNLSALQIAQLASAVSQLAGGGSTSLFDGLRNKLGVDDLDVTTDKGGGALVRAGKYLNDKTYIELQQGGDTGGAKATINLDVGRGVKLRGEAGSDGGGAGIFYEKEY